MIFNRYTITLSLQDIEDIIEAIDQDVYDIETNQNAEDNAIRKRLLEHVKRAKKIKMKLWRTIKD